MTAEPIRLLLIEDNPGDVRLLQVALAEEAPGKFAVTTADRLTDALARIRAERFDAVLCDLGLPDSVGLGTAQAIVAQAPALPLVVLTGTHDFELGRAAIELGAQDYLIKGETRAPMISRTLRYAIERKRLENQLREANEMLERRVSERTAELVAMNETLHESEEHYRAVTHSAINAIITADEDGKIAGWNPAAESTFGYTEAEALGMPLTRLMPERYRNAHLEGIRRVLADGKRHMQARTVELHGLTKAGLEFPLELSLSDWKTTKGQFFTGIIRDISERKHVQEAILWEKNFIHAALDSVPGLFYLFDERGRFLRWNRNFEIVSGYSSDEISRLSPTDFFTEPDKGIIAEKIRQVFLTGEETVEADFTAKDQTRTPYFFTGKLVQIDQKPCLIGMGIDISERKRAEVELRAAEEQFRGLVEQSIAGTYFIQDDKFVYVNPRFAEIFGYSTAEELIGRNPSLVVAEQDRETVAERLRQRINGDIARTSYQFTGLCKDGSTILIGGHGSPATHGGRPAVIGMIQDISEKARAEEQIQRHVAQLEKALMSTVQVATTLSELRDPYTAGHERRVADIAVAIGAELGFDAQRQEGLRVAGFLHDVGKITIPSEILSKPGKLTSIEFELVKRHTQAGYNVLQGVEFPWPVAEVALQHHERINGSGYPQGLKGEAILLEARVLAVADVVEAMSSHRPYRPGLGIDKALAEIERGQGTLYDVDVADACLRLFREKRYELPSAW